jgi:3D (Asp-Asp-Asp) domain-containing protein
MFKLAATLCAAALVYPATNLSAQAQDVLPKRNLPFFNAPSCQQIVANPTGFTVQQTTRTTQYFTPLFRPGPDGGLRPQDRHNCINVEGSCIVGNYLYNTGGGPWGTRYDLNTVKFVFGKGSGAGQYNTTNALFPCRTLAADRNHYRTGTVIYVPDFRNKICPQNGMPVDGCFIVGDVGSAIQGQGRFDLFTGECAAYSGSTNTCGDPNNAAFNVPVGTRFHVVPRDAPLATALRAEVDAFINNGWKP